MSAIALSYEALAERLGITLSSVRRMVHRHRWHRSRGNDGRTLVHVPEEYFARRDDTLQASPKACHQVSHRADQTAGPMADHMANPMATLVAELAAIRDELAGMAQRLATAEGRAGTAEMQAEMERRRGDELRQERDRLIARIDAAQDRHVAELMAVHERMARAEHDRDQALERLNLNIDRFDRVQAEHHAEIMSVRDQLAKAEHDRDRLTRELETHLRLPWWRRLFA